MQIVHVAIVGLIFAPASVWAQGSLDALGQSVQHSGEALGYSVAGAAQAVSAIAAAPLALSAEAGKVSGEMSEELLEAASAPIGTPLPVTDEVITVGPPPGEALRQGGQTP